MRDRVQRLRLASSEPAPAVPKADVARSAHEWNSFNTHALRDLIYTRVSPITDRVTYLFLDLTRRTYMLKSVRERWIARPA